MKKNRKRIFVNAMVALLFAASSIGVLAGCGKDEFEGLTVVTMYSSEAENAPIVKIAEEFTKETGIPVDVSYKSSAGGYRQWMLTQFASNRAPDILMTSRDWADVDIVNEYLYNLTDSLNTANEYYIDSPYATWRDSFTEHAMSRATYSLDNTQMYLIPLTMVSVRIMVNVEYLKTNAIEIPRAGYDSWDTYLAENNWTWNEYINICDQVQAKGFPVFKCANARAVDGPVGWVSDLIANMLFPEKIKQWDEDGNRSISCNEMIKIIMEGDLQYTDPEIMKVYDYIDKWKEYWAPAYNSTDMETALHSFFKKEVFSYMNGSWSALGQEKVLDNAFGDAYHYTRFEYRAMPFPLLTTENDPGCTYEKVPEIGDIGYAFAVSSMAKKRGHEEDAVKFLKYLTTKAKMTQWFEDNWNIPAVKDIALNAKIDEFNWVDNSEAYALRLLGASLPDSTISNKNFNQLQLYLTGQISREELGRKFQKILYDSAKDTADQYGWDASNNYGM